MKKLLLFVAVLATQFSFGQIQDGWAFFDDKENVAAALADPITILTQEALDRKALHGIVVDERDVPVNENYITQVKNATGITVLAKSKWMNCVYIQGTEADINNLLNLPFVSSVEFADKNLNLFPVSTGVTDKFQLENETSRIVYDYGQAANQVEMIGIDHVHEQDFTGEGMIAAVLDSGFPNITSIGAFAHIVNENRLLGTYDFAGRQEDVTGTGSHGTRTFSDMGGLLDGDFVGTSPNASYYLFRTEFAPTEVPVEEAWWVEAMERADSLGVDVVNTSLGYQDYDNPNYDHSYDDLDGQTTFAARGANLAFEKGMLLVTSAGNDGGGFTFVATPADAPGVLTVGAVDSNGNYASFSSIGPTVDGRVKPDVMAKGASAAVVDAAGFVTTSSGTSFSSPIMAGAVTSLWQARPETTNAELMQIIRESSSLFDTPTDEMGYGIPNFEEALNALNTFAIEEQLLDLNFAVYPNPTSDVINISFPKGIETATVTMYNVLGTQVMRSEVTTTSNRIDVSRLSTGVYVARIEHQNTSNSFKIIKK